MQPEPFFDNVPDPAQNLVGEEGEGLHIMLFGMHAKLISIAAQCFGDAQHDVAVN